MARWHVATAWGVALLLACSGCGDGRPRGRHYEKAGKFSYDPPAGWEIVELPGLKYRISRGAPVKGFAPNINGVDEASSVALRDHVVANVKVIEAMWPSLGVLDRSDFRTTDGLLGHRMVTQRSEAKAKLRQTYYFFPSGGRKYVVTCTTLAEAGEALDATFDTSMRTFRLR